MTENKLIKILVVFRFVYFILLRKSKPKQMEKPTYYRMTHPVLITVGVWDGGVKYRDREVKFLTDQRDPDIDDLIKIVMPKSEFIQVDLSMKKYPDVIVKIKQLNTNTNRTLYFNEI